MYARVATFESSDPDRARKGFEEIKRRAGSGPSPGLPALGLLVLHDPDGGKILSITLFETEEDLRQVDSTLNSMQPPAPGPPGRRVSVETYEVPVKIDV